MKERPMWFTHPGIGEYGPWVGWADPEKIELGWQVWADRERESVALRARPDVREQDLAAARVVVKRRARLAEASSARFRAAVEWAVLQGVTVAPGNPGRPE